MKISDLIYDWNRVDEPDRAQHPVELDDETLRDGLQSPSVRDPSAERKIEILHLMDDLGIDSADIGLPGAGPRAFEDTLRLATAITRDGLKIRPNCAARTHRNDIAPVVEISQKAGIAVEACTFLGSSTIRQYVEDWSLDLLLKHTEDAVRFAVGEGLPVMFVTEDTTRAHPDTVRALYKSAIECGARRICVCDTVGHATPSGARAVIRHVRRVVEESGESVKIDWHGHMDRGLGVINAIAAYEAGATRLHGTALGVGERVGNAPMDQLLVNLKLLGYIDRDLSALQRYCEAASAATGIPIPVTYPVVGRDAFRTATGVHAAAVVKALRKGDRNLADLVYSGVPAHLFGRAQEIEIGPMSGRSNVVFWLEQRGIEATDETVDRVFAMAKRSSRVLRDEEILAELR